LAPGVVLVSDVRDGRDVLDVASADVQV